MNIAFVLYQELTFLDLIGFYDPITRLKTMGFMPDLRWDMCALEETIRDDRGLAMLANCIGGSLENYDLIFIPGGMGTRTLQHDESFIRWIQTGTQATWKVSVCTGSLILGAAGFLETKQATTHPSAVAELAPYCSHVAKERIVEDGNIITGAGVASSIDLGLYMVELLTDADVRQKIATQMDYPYSYGKAL